MPHHHRQRILLLHGGSQRHQQRFVEVAAQAALGTDHQQQLPRAAGMRHGFRIKTQKVLRGRFDAGHRAALRSKKGLQPVDFQQGQVFHRDHDAVDFVQRRQPPLYLTPFAHLKTRLTTKGTKIPLGKLHDIEHPPPR